MISHSMLWDVITYPCLDTCFWHTSPYTTTHKQYLSPTRSNEFTTLPYPTLNAGILIASSWLINLTHACWLWLLLRTFYKIKAQLRTVQAYTVTGVSFHFDHYFDKICRNLSRFVRTPFIFVQLWNQSCVRNFIIFAPDQQTSICTWDVDTWIPTINVAIMALNNCTKQTHGKTKSVEIRWTQAS